MRVIRRYRLHNLRLFRFLDQVGLVVSECPTPNSLNPFAARERVFSGSAQLCRGWRAQRTRLVPVTAPQHYGDVLDNMSASFHFTKRLTLRLFDPT